MVWYEELGFDDDPFENDPLKRDDKLLGRDKQKEEIIYRIASGSMLLMVGKDGIGKTMMLRHAIDRFKGKGKVIYIDASKVGKRLNIEKLLTKGAGMIKGTLLGAKPQGMILLLDNVQNLTERNNKRIKYYFDQDYILSVVFTTSDYGALAFTDSIKDRIGKRVMKLRDLPAETVIAIVKDRLQGNEILTEEMIKDIYTLSGRNLKTTLENSGKVCAYAFDKGDEIVNKDHITEALKEDHGASEDTHEETCHECGEALINIRKEWRCPHCDTYCINCGGFVYDEDTKCATCGVEFEDEGERDDK